MNCPSCGTENIEDAVYCMRCGRRLDGTAECPNCKKRGPCGMLRRSARVFHCFGGSADGCGRSCRSLRRVCRSRRPVRIFAAAARRRSRAGAPLPERSERAESAVRERRRAELKISSFCRQADLKKLSLSADGAPSHEGRPVRYILVSVLFISAKHCPHLCAHAL